MPPAMPPAGNPRHELLRLAERVLANIIGRTPRRLRVVLSDGRTSVVLRADRRELHALPDELPRKVRIVLGSFDPDRPAALSGKQIARKTGYSYSSALRTTLA